MKESQMKNSQTRKAPVFAMGWDAATWERINPLLETGKLPHLQSLITSGAAGTLYSVPQPVSPAAWTTIITGVNPARHGVFDWFERQAGSYAVSYVHTGRISAKPAWKYFNDAGQRVGMFNLPMVYPAVPVEGFMVSGMAAPGAKAKDFAYPDGLLAKIEAEIGPYQTSESVVYGTGKEVAYLQAVLDWLKYQKETARYLIQNHPADLYLMVFMQIDHAQHKLWHFPEALDQVYEAMDDLLGECIKWLPSQTNFVVLSDHGAGPMDGVVYLNAWLRQEGYLHMKRSLGGWIKRGVARIDLFPRLYRVAARIGLGGLANLLPKATRNQLVSGLVTLEDVDWSRTKAYARGSFGQIFINRQGREPQGIVSEAEYPALVSEIMEKLKTLRHPKTGEALVMAPWQPKDNYAGPFANHAADINFNMGNFRLQTSVKISVRGGMIFGPSEYDDTGTHRLDGMWVMAGPAIEAGVNLPDADLVDVLPTLLALSGLPVPERLDGKPAAEAFTAEVRESIQFSNARVEIGEGNEGSLGRQDVEDLEERLRNLGYLG